MSDLNPCAGSVLMIAGGPSSGRSWMQSWIRVSRSEVCRSSLMKLVAVKDVTVSRSTSMS